VAGLALVCVPAYVVASADDTAGGPTARVPLADIQADVDYTSSFADLVSRSSLVVSGTPIGKPTFRKLARGSAGDFTQLVAVHDVYNGSAPSTVRVVRFGALPGREASLAEDLGGPLPAGPAVYFLKPSAEPSTYQAAGHTQGVLQVDGAGRISDVGLHGFAEFAGQHVTEIEKRLTSR
jgi:hypothetical protein